MNALWFSTIEDIFLALWREDFRLCGNNNSVNAKGYRVIDLRSWKKRKKGFPVFTEGQIT